MPTFHEWRIKARLSVNKLSRAADVDFRTAMRADQGEPIQEVKAAALLEALSEELDQPLTYADVTDLKFS